MRGSHLTAWVLVAGLCASAAGSGCHGTTKRAAATEPGLAVGAEPTLGAPIAQGTTVAPGGTGVTWVDRHPLFSKPREWYETTNSDNKVVKGVAATFIGVPAGFFGELRQIVTGSTPATRY
jgi:hypothetical protein